MYFDVSESTLPTTEVNEGRPSDPGAGWMTSAPMTMVGLAGSAKYRTEAGSGTVLIPPSFTLILW